MCAKFDGDGDEPGGERTRTEAGVKQDRKRSRGSRNRAECKGGSRESAVIGHLRDLLVSHRSSWLQIVRHKRMVRCGDQWRRWTPARGFRNTNAVVGRLTIRRNNLCMAKN